MLLRPHLLHLRLRLPHLGLLAQLLLQHLPRGARQRRGDIRRDLSQVASVLMGHGQQLRVRLALRRDGLGAVVRDSHLLALEIAWLAPAVRLLMLLLLRLSLLLRRLGMRVRHLGRWCRLLHTWLRRGGTAGRAVDHAHLLHLLSLLLCLQLRQLCPSHHLHLHVVLLLLWCHLNRLSIRLCLLLLDMHQGLLAHLMLPVDLLYLFWRQVLHVMGASTLHTGVTTCLLEIALLCLKHHDLLLGEIDAGITLHHMRRRHGHRKAVSAGRCPMHG